MNIILLFIRDKTKTSTFSLRNWIWIWKTRRAPYLGGIENGGNCKTVNVRVTLTMRCSVLGVRMYVRMYVCMYVCCGMWTASMDQSTYNAVLTFQLIITNDSQTENESGFNYFFPFLYFCLLCAKRRMKRRNVFTNRRCKQTLIFIFWKI